MKRITLIAKGETYTVLVVINPRRIIHAELLFRTTKRLNQDETAN